MLLSMKTYWVDVMGVTVMNSLGTELFEGLVHELLEFIKHFGYHTLPLQEIRSQGNICLPHGVYGCSNGDIGDDAPEASSGYREEET